MKKLSESFKVACVVLVCAYGFSMVAAHVATNLSHTLHTLTASL